MAKLTATRMTDNTPGSNIDDYMGALETDVADLIGATLETTYTAGAVPIVTTKAREGVASGVATLNASVKVVQNPAAAIAINPVVSAGIPLGRISPADGCLDSSWGGNRASLATLTDSTTPLVVQLPAAATTTPTATSIPLALGTGKISIDWLANTQTATSATAVVLTAASGYIDDALGGTAGSLATLDANTGVVQSKIIDTSPTSYDGTLLSVTAHENVSAGQLVYLNADLEAALAANTATAQMGIVGVAVANALTGATVKVLTHGALALANTYGTGNVIYAGTTAGSLTTTYPTGTSAVKTIGVAVDNNNILVSADPGWKYADNSVYSAFKWNSNLAAAANTYYNQTTAGTYTTYHSATMNLSAISSSINVKHSQVVYKAMIFNGGASTATCTFALRVQKGAGTVTAALTASSISIATGGLGYYEIGADVTSLIDAGATSYTLYLTCPSGVSNGGLTGCTVQGSFEVSMLWQ